VSQEFIGAGWAYPLDFDSSGGIALTSHEKKVQESIRLILGTAPGERPMRPEFGCRIHDEVFASVDAATAGRIAFEVRAALTRWEPRIELQEVRVEPAPADQSMVYIDVRYTISGSNDPRNLVFPFYVIPEER
jgi:phage baseplate assembly protein W